MGKTFEIQFDMADFLLNLSHGTTGLFRMLWDVAHFNQFLQFSIKRTMWTALLKISRGHCGLILAHPWE